MFTILFETNNNGFYLGADATLSDAKVRFNVISNDIIEQFNLGKVTESNYFEMYGVFNLAEFANEYQCYKISNHKNQLIDFKLIFEMVDFSLYVVKIENKFDPANLKRNQNYFHYINSKYMAGSIELFLN